MVGILRLIIVFFFAASSAYGQRAGGAPWTEEEVWSSSVTYWTSKGGMIHALLSQVLVVRAKLWRMFSGGHPLEQASDDLTSTREGN